MVEVVRAGKPTEGASRQFAEAVRRVDRLGGGLEFDAGVKLIGVDLARDHLSATNADIAALACLPHLEKLKLAGGQITQEGVKQICSLANLVELELQNTPLDDQGLEQLTGLVKLKSLNLQGSVSLTDRGLDHAGKFPELTHLYLLDNNLTNQGIAKLAAVPRLELLDLRGCTQVDDAGLAGLAELANLKCLTLRSPTITDAGLAVLKGFGSLSSDFGLFLSSCWFFTIAIATSERSYTSRPDPTFFGRRSIAASLSYHCWKIEPIAYLSFVQPSFHTCCFFETGSMTTIIRSAQETYLMLGRGSIWDTACRCEAVLNARGFRHAFVGGVAVCLHGYPRNTVDVDILVRREDAVAVRTTLEEEGFVWDPAEREFRSPDNVPVQFLIAGDSASDDRTLGVSVPDPGDPGVTTEIEKLSVVSLARLIELKLACGLGNLRRTHRDFADVVELITVHRLSRRFARHLHKSLRKEFRNLVLRARGQS